MKTSQLEKPMSRPEIPMPLPWSSFSITETISTGLCRSSIFQLLRLHGFCCNYAHRKCPFQSFSCQPFWANNNISVWRCQDSFTVTLWPHPITEWYGLEEHGNYQECVKQGHSLNCRFSGLGKQVIGSQFHSTNDMQYNTVQHNRSQIQWKIPECIIHIKSKYYISGCPCVHVRVFWFKTYFLLFSAVKRISKALSSTN